MSPKNPFEDIGSWFSSIKPKPDVPVASLDAAASEVRREKRSPELVKSLGNARLMVAWCVAHGMGDEVKELQALLAAAEQQDAQVDEPSLNEHLERVSNLLLERLQQREGEVMLQLSQPNESISEATRSAYHEAHKFLGKNRLRANLYERADVPRHAPQIVEQLTGFDKAELQDATKDTRDRIKRLRHHWDMIQFACRREKIPALDSFHEETDTRAQQALSQFDEMIQNADSTTLPSYAQSCGQEFREAEGDLTREVEGALEQLRVRYEAMKEAVSPRYRENFKLDEKAANKIENCFTDCRRAFQEGVEYQGSFEQVISVIGRASELLFEKGISDEDVLVWRLAEITEPIVRDHEARQKNAEQFHMTAPEPLSAEVAEAVTFLTNEIQVIPRESDAATLANVVKQPKIAIRGSNDQHVPQLIALIAAMEPRKEQGAVPPTSLEYKGEIDSRFQADFKVADVFFRLYQLFPKIKTLENMPAKGDPSAAYTNHISNTFFDDSGYKQYGSHLSLDSLGRELEKQVYRVAAKSGRSEALQCDDYVQNEEAKQWLEDHRHQYYDYVQRTALYYIRLRAVIDDKKTRDRLDDLDVQAKYLKGFDQRFLHEDARLLQEVSSDIQVYRDDALLAHKLPQFESNPLHDLSNTHKQFSTWSDVLSEMQRLIDEAKHNPELSIQIQYPERRYKLAALLETCNIVTEQLAKKYENQRSLQDIERTLTLSPEVMKSAQETLALVVTVCEARTVEGMTQASGAIPLHNVDTRIEDLTSELQKLSSCAQKKATEYIDLFKQHSEMVNQKVGVVEEAVDTSKYIVGSQHTFAQLPHLLLQIRKVDRIAREAGLVKVEEKGTPGDGPPVEKGMKPEEYVGQTFTVAEFRYFNRGRMEFPGPAKITVDRWDAHENSFGISVQLADETLLSLMASIDKIQEFYGQRVSTEEAQRLSTEAKRKSLEHKQEDPIGEALLNIYKLFPENEKTKETIEGVMKVFDEQPSLVAFFATIPDKHQALQRVFEVAKNGDERVGLTASEAVRIKSEAYTILASFSDKGKNDDESAKFERLANTAEAYEKWKALLYRKDLSDYQNRVRGAKADELDYAGEIATLEYGLDQAAGGRSFATVDLLLSHGRNVIDGNALSLVHDYGLGDKTGEGKNDAYAEFKVWARNKFEENLDVADNFNQAWLPREMAHRVFASVGIQIKVPLATRFFSSFKPRGVSENDVGEASVTCALLRRKIENEMEGIPEGDRLETSFQKNPALGYWLAQRAGKMSGVFTDAAIEECVHWMKILKEAFDTGEIDEAEFRNLTGEIPFTALGSLKTKVFVTCQNAGEVMDALEDTLKLASSEQLAPLTELETRKKAEAFVMEQAIAIYQARGLGTITEAQLREKMKMNDRLRASFAAKVSARVAFVKENPEK